MKKGKPALTTLLLSMVCWQAAVAFTVAPTVTHLDPEIPLSGSVSMSISSGTAPYTLYGFGGTAVYPTDEVAVFDGLGAGTYHVKVTDSTGDSVVLDLDVLYGIAWRNTVNVATTLHTVDKTSGGNGWNAGAYSYNHLPPNTDGYILFTAPTITSYIAIGLSKDDYSFDNGSLKYAFSLSNTGIRPMVGGQAINTSASSYTAGDVFKMAREGNDIKFYKNGTLLYTHATTADERLFIDYHVFSDGTSAQVPKITSSFGIPLATVPTITHQTPGSAGTGSIDPGIVGGVPPYTYLWSSSATAATLTGLDAGTYGLTVTDASSATVSATYQVDYGILWRNELNVSTTVSSITKDAIANSYNAGASTKNMLKAGQDGYIWFEVPNAIYLGAFGLSIKDYSVAAENIRYQFRFSNGNIVIMVGNVSQGTFGTTAPGDVYGIGRSGNTIQFLKNGILLYGYVAGSGEHLVADASLFYGGGSLLNISSSFGIPFMANAEITNCQPTNNNSGAIDLFPDGGTAPYTYLWSGSGTSGSRTGLGAGSYTVTITDAASATVSETFSVGYQVKWMDTVGVSVTPQSITQISSTAGGGASKNFLPAGQDGYVDFEISQVSGYYNFGLAVKNYEIGRDVRYGFNIAPNVATAYVNGTGAGISQVLKVGDMLRLERLADSIYFKLNGQAFHKLYADPNEEMQLDFNLDPSARPVIVVPSFRVNFRAYPSVTNNLPDSHNSGKITLSPDGGVAPYTYLWGDGNTAASRTGLAAGTYRVTVTDAASLTVSETIRVGYQVKWINTVDVATDSQTIVKTSLSAGGGSSKNELAAGQDGYVHFEIKNARGWCAFGLVKTDYQVANSDIRYGFFLTPANVSAYVSGSSVAGTSRPLKVGDLLGLERVADTIYFRLNGNLLHKRQVNPEEDLAFDFVFTSSEQPVAVVPSFGVPFGGYPQVIHNLADRHTSGEAMLFPDGGIAPYTYLWGDGGTSQNRTGLAAGAYGVTITDAVGSTTTETVTVGYQIRWRDMVNVDTTGNSVTRNIATGGYTAGAASWNLLGPQQDGFAEFELPNGSLGYQIMGLSRNNYGLTNNSFLYGIGTNPNICRGLANGVAIGPSLPFMVGDVFRLERAGDSMYYKLNGIVFHKIWVDNTESLLLDVSLISAHRINVILSFGIPLGGDADITPDDSTSNAAGALALNPQGGVAPYSYQWNDGSTAGNRTGVPAGHYSVTITDANASSATEHYRVPYMVYWQNVTNANVTPGSIYRSTSGGGWASGASSLNRLLPYANGYIEFEFSPEAYLQVGFSTADVGTDPSAMEYGIRITSGVIGIYQSGSLVASGFGNARLGDRFRVARVGSEIRYYRNGSLLHTGSTDNSLQLRLDASLVSTPFAVPVDISFGAPFSVNGSVTGISGGSAANGAISLAVAGGYGPYTYAWSNSGLEKDQNGLAMGNYTVTITDYLGNQTTGTFNVGHGPTLYWTGAEDSDWGNGNNWSWSIGGPSAGQVPGTSNIVYFNNVVNTIVFVSSIPIEWAGLETGADFGGVLDFRSAELYLTGSLIQIGGALEFGEKDLTVDGSIILSGGTFNAPSGTFAIGGSFYDLSGGFAQDAGKLLMTGTGKDLASQSPIYQLELYNGATVALASDLYLQNKLILTDGVLTLDYHDLYILNKSAEALERIEGGIVSETYDFTSLVHWEIGENVDKYIIPFISEEGTYLPITYDIQMAGVATNGLISFGTFATDPTFYPNNSPAPPGANNYNSLEAIDRYWLATCSNYQQCPEYDLNIRYAPLDISGNNDVDDQNLQANYWDGEDWQEHVSTFDDVHLELALEGLDLHSFWCVSSTNLSTSPKGASCDNSALLSGPSANYVYSLEGEEFWFKHLTSGTSLDFSICQMRSLGDIEIKKILLYSGSCGSLTQLEELTVSDPDNIVFSKNGLTDNTWYLVKLVRADEE